MTFSMPEDPILASGAVHYYEYLALPGRDGVTVLSGPDRQHKETESR
jgi:hypothetical protein